MSSPNRADIGDSDWEDDGMSDGEREYRRGLEEDEKMGYESSGEDPMSDMRRGRGPREVYQELGQVGKQSQSPPARIAEDSAHQTTSKTLRLVRPGIETPLSPVMYLNSPQMEQWPESDHPAPSPDVRPATATPPSPSEDTRPAIRTLEVSNTAHAKEQGKTTDGIYRYGIDTPWSPFYAWSPPQASNSASPSGDLLSVPRNGPENETFMLPPPLSQASSMIGLRTLSASEPQQLGLASTRDEAVLGEPPSFLPPSLASFALPMRPALSSSTTSATSSLSLGIGQRRKLVQEDDAGRNVSSKSERKIKKSRGRPMAAQRRTFEDTNKYIKL